MTNHELERQLRDWYAADVSPTEPAPSSLYQQLAALAENPPLIPPTLLRRRMTLLAAAALLAALAAGAVAVGSGVVKLPQLVPPPLLAPVPSRPPLADVSPTALASLPPDSPAPSDLAPAGPPPWIAYFASRGPDAPDRGGLWAVRADGSGAREIGDAGPMAWSKDGTRLLVGARGFHENGSITVSEVGADFGPFVDTGIKEPTNEQWEAYDFAPDGEQVVFVRKYKCPTGSAPFGISLAETAGANCYVLTVANLRTGELTGLSETLMGDPGGNRREGSLELPAWSPDGTRIAYTRIADDQGQGQQRELMIVNADGTNPSRIELEANVPVREPRWSPDSTRISFMSDTFLGGAWTSAVYVADVGTGRLERITAGSDPDAGNLCCAGWLDNTHLRVQSLAGQGTLETGAPCGQVVPCLPIQRVTIGGNPDRAEALVDLRALLTATGAPLPSTVSTPGDPGRTYYWQPVAVNQP